MFPVHTVLSIDATITPAEALLIEIEGQDLRVIERRTIDLDVRSLAGLKEPTVEMSESTETSETNEPQTTDEWVLDPIEDAPTSNRDLRSAFQDVREWDNSILFVPPENCISLSLRLPFGDTKTLSKILPSEVQDSIPFELEDFHLQYRVLGQSSPGEWNVHVSLIPHRYMERVIALCRERNFEPAIVSTPASAIEAAFLLKRELLGERVFVVFTRGTTHHTAACINGKVLSERTFSEESFSAISKDELLAQIRITLRALEARFGITFDSIISMGEEIDLGVLSRGLGREVRRLSGSDLFPSHGTSSEVATLGALFAQDYPAPEILTNFRTSRYAFNPQLKELKRGLKASLPYLGVLLFMVSVLFAGHFGVRAWKIASLREEMSRKVREVIPSLSLREGQGISVQIQSQIDSLDAVMKDLVAPSASSLLDLLLNVSDLLPKEPGIEYRRISIKPSRITIEGSAPDYAATERIEKALRKSKVPWKVETPETPRSSGASPAREFSIEIRITES